LLVEVGGTVGDIESMPFLEADRQMRGEMRRNDSVQIVTLFPERWDSKTKHQIGEVRELGLYADIIVGRSERDQCRDREDIGVLRSQRAYLRQRSTVPGADGDGEGRVAEVLSAHLA
jgi:CTP synthase (UTP-ammonia lyase)